MCMQHLVSCQNNARYVIYTDNRATFQKWHNREHVKVYKEQMWEDIHNTMLLLDVKGVSIDLRKVKSHATHEQMEQGLSSPELKIGNDRADHWAGEGAKIYQVPDNIISIVNQIDAESWIIQKRLLTIVKSCQTNNKHEKLQAMARINQLNSQIEEQGHQIEVHQGGWYSCLQCGQSWHTKHRNNIIARGTCPGPEIWETTSGMYPDILVRVVRGSELVWAGQQIHKTHSVCWKQGLVICMRCGCYSQGTRMIGLVKKCKGKTGDMDSRIRLRRFRCGMHPVHKGKWPLYAGASPPVQFSDLLPAS